VSPLEERGRQRRLSRRGGVEREMALEGNIFGGANTPSLPCGDKLFVPFPYQREHMHACINLHLMMASTY
jgi:hypothetical protein